MNNAESPTSSGAAHGSATCFTFMSDDGKYPVAPNGKVQWLSDRDETIRQAKSWGFNILVEMGNEGRLLGMVNLNEMKSPNAELCHGSEPLASAIGSGAVSATYEPQKNK